MKFIVSLCFVLLLLLLGLAAAREEKILFAVHDSSVEALLSKGFDVRGTYGTDPSFTLVVAHRAQKPAGAKIIVPMTENLEVVISEVVGDNRAYFLDTMHACRQFAKVLCFGDACVSVFGKQHEQSFQQCVPFNAELVVLPPTSVRAPAAFVASSKFVKSALIEQLVAEVSIPTLTGFLTTLTNFNTRQSQSAPAIEASEYLRTTFIKHGLNATREFFRTGYSDNVIAEIPGTANPSKIVIIGAHYDCRMATLNSVTARAPGANDDGSGTAALLEFSRILGEKDIRLPYTLRLIAWSGEEQGLYGSTFYADREKANNRDIVAMLQGDMIAFQRGNSLALDLGSRFTTPALNDQLFILIRQYVPELVLGTNNGCCSDQQPFFNNGYAATSFIHQGGPTVDPQYHQTGDTVNRNNYSLPLVQAISRAIFAGALTIGGL